MYGMQDSLFIPLLIYVVVGIEHNDGVCALPKSINQENTYLYRFVLIVYRFGTTQRDKYKLLPIRFELDILWEEKSRRNEMTSGTGCHPWQILRSLSLCRIVPPELPQQNVISHYTIISQM